MTAKSRRRRSSRQTLARSPAAPSARDMPPAIRSQTRISERTRAADRARTHRSPRRAYTKRMPLAPEWIRAGLVLAGILLAVVVAVYALGRPGPAPAPAASATAGAQQAGANNGGTGTAGSSGVYVSSGGSGGQPLPPVTETAKALGISTAALLADIQSGQTVPQLAQQQHVPLATVNAAYLRGVQELNVTFVQSGAASQETADQVYQQEQQQVQNGVYDLLRTNNGPVSVGG